jgi:ferrous iron transport protein B
MTQTPSSTRSDTVVVLGSESVGKSALLAGLTGRWIGIANFGGSTLACTRYPDGNTTWVDTPGILFDDETETGRAALREVARGGSVLLVVHAATAGADLTRLLPVVHGRTGMVAITHWDRVADHPDAATRLHQFIEQIGVPVVAADARNLTPDQAQAIRCGLAQAATFDAGIAVADLGWPLPDARDIMAHPVLGPALALIALFLPAVAAVLTANAFADAQFDRVQDLFAPWLDTVNQWPAPLDHLAGRDYGFIAMFPFLLLYALPTVILFAAFLAIYKTSGLIDRLTYALHPWLRPFGLTGRDLVRVIMGFGCNVPAVIQTRSCSVCSRGACVSAISFGSACSYQLPATLAVFTAAGMSFLALPYLGFLALTTLLFLRFTVPPELRAANRTLVLSRGGQWQWPSGRALVREIGEILHQFVLLALPVFVVICGVAGLLQWSGVLDLLARALAPVMALFNLPGDASIAVLLGSIRKDGLAIGLLDADWEHLKVGLVHPIQVLTAVYLAGVLLPCIVTLFTIARELSPRFAVRLAGRQIAFASLFSLILAWTGWIWIHLTH